MGTYHGISMCIIEVATAVTATAQPRAATAGAPRRGGGPRHNGGLRRRGRQHRRGRRQGPGQFSHIVKQGIFFDIYIYDYIYIYL